MSYRKHKTLPQLRAELSKVQTHIETKRAVKARLEDEVARIQERIHDLGTDIHKFQQIEGSCRLWIARKETGQCT